MSGRANMPTAADRKLLAAVLELKREATLEALKTNDEHTADVYRELAADLGKILNLTLFAPRASTGFRRQPCR